MVRSLYIEDKMWNDSNIVFCFGNTLFVFFARILQLTDDEEKLLVIRVTRSVECCFEKDKKKQYSLIAAIFKNTRSWRQPCNSNLTGLFCFTQRSIHESWNYQNYDLLMEFFAIIPWLLSYLSSLSCFQQCRTPTQIREYFLGISEHTYFLKTFISLCWWILSPIL